MATVLSDANIASLEGANKRVTNSSEKWISETEVLNGLINEKIATTFSESSARGKISIDALKAISKILLGQGEDIKALINATNVYIAEHKEANGQI